VHAQRLNMIINMMVQKALRDFVAAGGQVGDDGRAVVVYEYD
jgi:hypothetical protein